MKEIVSQYKNIITAQIDGDFQTLRRWAVLIGYDDVIHLMRRFPVWKNRASAMTLPAWDLSHLHRQDIL